MKKEKMRLPQSFSLPGESVDTLTELAAKKKMNKSKVVEEALKKEYTSFRGEDELNKRKPMVVSLIAYKGGAGKTTTGVNIAVSLAEAGHKVLVIDLDGQGNASQYIDVFDAYATQPCIADVMLTKGNAPRMSLLDVRIQGASAPKVDIVPSNFRFNDGNAKLRNEESSNIASRLRYAIEDMIKEMESEGEEPYEYIFVDCPPNIGLTAMNAVEALKAGHPSSFIMVPVQMDGFAIAGLIDTVKMIKSTAAESRCAVPNWMVVPTMFNQRNNVSAAALEEIVEALPDTQFTRTRIPVSTKVPESTMLHNPCVLYEPASKPSKAYVALAKEVEEMRDGE